MERLYIFCRRKPSSANPRVSVDASIRPFSFSFLRYTEQARRILPCRKVNERYGELCAQEDKEEVFGVKLHDDNNDEIFT